MIIMHSSCSTKFSSAVPINKNVNVNLVSMIFVVQLTSVGRRVKEFIKCAFKNTTMSWLCMWLHKWLTVLVECCKLAIDFLFFITPLSNTVLSTSIDSDISLIIFCFFFLLFSFLGNKKTQLS